MERLEAKLLNVGLSSNVIHYSVIGGVLQFHVLDGIHELGSVCSAVYVFILQTLSKDLVQDPIVACQAEVLHKVILSTVRVTMQDLHQ